MKPDAWPSTLEFVFGDRFNLRLLLIDRLVVPLPALSEQWSARGHQAQRRRRLAEMGQDVADCAPIDEESDDSHLATKARAGGGKTS